MSMFQVFFVNSLLSVSLSLTLAGLVTGQKLQDVNELTTGTAVLHGSYKLFEVLKALQNSGLRQHAPPVEVVDDELSGCCQQP